MTKAQQPLKVIFYGCLVSCFVGSVVGIKAFGIVFYPLRVITLLGIPFLLMNTNHHDKGVRGYARKFLIAFFIYGTISLLWSPNLKLGFSKLGILLTGVLLFLIIVKGANNREIFRRIFIVWSVVIICLGLFAFYEIISGSYLFMTDEARVSLALESVGRVYGWTPPRVFSGNWNNLAFIMAISALVLLGWTIETRGVSRLIGWISVAFAITVVIATSSRAAFFGLMIGLMIFFSGLLMRRKYALITVGILFVAGLGFSLSAVNKQSIFDTMLSNVMRRFELADYDVRKELYGAAIKSGTLESYGFGRGLGASDVTIQGHSYHHFMLEILAEFGIWMFLGYMILFYKICAGLTRAIRLKIRIPLAMGMISSCLGFPVLCAGPSSVIGEGPYWLWLAVLVINSDVVPKYRVTRAHEYKAK